MEYWDPTKFALVDSMHNLFLGELRHHCRDVWGINIKDNSHETQKITPHTPEEQQKWIDHILSALQTRSLRKIMQARKGYIVAVAKLNGVIPRSKKFGKAEYADALLSWVRTTSRPMPSELHADFMYTR